MRPTRHPTKESFLDDVKDHVMTIEHEDGIYRTVRFGKPDKGLFHFKLTTWPGHLCFSGDMGCYVFSRLPDMFEFFTTSKNDLEINSGYWHEKLVSISRFGGYSEFSEERFREVIRDYVTSHINHLGLRDAIDLWTEVRDSILHYGAENEYQARDLVAQFSHESGFEFGDFWEVTLTEKTYHAIWSLWAIRWGIMKYEANKNE